MATSAKKVTQTNDQGIPIRTFESISEAVRELESIGMTHAKLKAAIETGSLESGFKFKFEEGDAEEAPTEKVISMSESQLAKMLKGVEEKISERFESRLSGAPSAPLDMERFAEIIGDAMNPNAIKRYSARSEASVDPADYLDEPIQFFCYLHYFSIHGEKRYGHEVTTPYNRPIVFQNISGHVSGAGVKGRQTVQVSACQITTQKELEWMRKSPKMGVIVFESISEQSSIDHEMATKLAQALVEISSLTEYQVTQKAIDKGIKASKDIDWMRTELIKRIAEESVDLAKRVSINAASSAQSTIEDTKKRGAQPAGVTVKSY